MPQLEVKIDRVRVDVLLWALEGFADEGEVGVGKHGRWTPERIRAMRRLAAEGPFKPHGYPEEAQSLKAELGQKTLNTLFARIRHGQEPKCWRHVA